MSDFRLIYTNTDGGVSIVVPAPGITIEQAATAVPPGVPYEVISKEDVPGDRMFRNAWVKSGAAVEHNMSKVKEIAHGHRRSRREKLFSPHDSVIAKQIPGKNAVAAELARAAIRTQDTAVQLDIDAATTPAEVKAVLQEYGAV